MRKENDIYAPVIIPTLCRYEHFKRCVESLSKCSLADKTELIIGLDYPAKDEHVDGYSKICKYVDTICGFKKVTVLRTDHNLGFGPKGNYARLKEYALQHYDMFICSEDDNEFSPNFLEYMNKSLIKYKEDERIMAICGYNYPVDMKGYDKNIYASHEYSAWGTGYWKNKEFGLKQSRRHMEIVLHSPKSLWMLFWKRPGIIVTLINMMESGAFWGDTCRVTLSYLEDKYTIGPTVSKVRNHGHDGSGEHCVVSNRFENQVIDINRHIVLDDIPIKALDLQSFKDYFAISFKNRLFLVKRLFQYYFKTKHNGE